MKKLYCPGKISLMRKIGVSLAAASLITACASVPPPTEQMAISKTEVSNASKAGANELAPIQLKSAMEKMDAAEHAMASKNYVEARQLAEQAEVDAQLASAMARSAKAQKAADAVQEDARVLRQEINRKTK